MTLDFFHEKPKTGLGFEIGRRQQNFQRRLTLHSLANPAAPVKGLIRVIKGFLGLHEG